MEVTGFEPVAPTLRTYPDRIKSRWRTTDSDDQPVTTAHCGLTSTHARWHHLALFCHPERPFDARWQLLLNGRWTNPACTRLNAYYVHLCRMYSTASRVLSRRVEFPSRT